MSTPQNVVVVAVALLALGPRAEAQGVIARHPSGGAACFGAGPESHPGATCVAIGCGEDRTCIDLPGLAHCLDIQNEVVCIPGEGGCDACPLTSAGAGPEACRVFMLESGPHTLCVYGVQLLCVADPGSTINPLACLPPDPADPSLGNGDCDEDGHTNAEDGCVCEPASGSPRGCPFDAGMPSPDAGLEAEDAGPKKDGGGIDASRPGRDARPGRDEPTLRFHGSGGCDCIVTSPSPSRPSAPQAPLAMTAAAAALLVLRSRRRRENR